MAEAPSRIIAVRVGLANHYKAGHWTPVRVEVSSSLEDLRVEVTVTDSDGVATTASGPLQPASNSESNRSALVYTKIGRVGASIRVALMDGETQLDRRSLPAGGDAAAATSLVGLPATGELLVSLSSAPFGFAEAFADRQATSDELARRTVQLNRAADLPTEWFGYEAVDLLVISAGDGELCRGLKADRSRYEALVRWIELGGRLVILCGGESAEQLLAEGGALAGLVPGKLQDMVQLTETGPLEHFAEPAAAISAARRGTALPVPQLADVEGRIEVYAGRRPTDLPIVVRAARGLGEVAFAGLDLTAPPLADWSGRTRFLQALVRPYIVEGELADAPQTLVTLGYNDLSGALRQRLGRSFATVVLIGFPLAAALVFAYLLVLGPIDYLLVHRWLRRPLAAWITFPVIVLLFGFGALGLAEWRKGPGGPRLNQLELIDIDMVTGQARGTFWATLYSPTAEQFDLSLEVAPPTAQTSVQAESLLSWWGLPGVGIGGMQAGGANLGIVRQAYRYAPELDALDGLPILASSTKSLLARWTAPAGELLQAELTDNDGYATGVLINRSGQTLRNARLLYGLGGYRLGNLAEGQQIDVGEHLDSRRVKTIVTSSALGSVAAQSDRAGSVFVPERAPALELLNAMMFYQAAGGAAFAQLPNQYQAYCDLSRLVDLGRAIFVAEAEGPGSRLVNPATGEALGGQDDFANVVVRFVLPVTKNEVEP